jgi:trans-aconitate methyltransferase
VIDVGAGASNLIDSLATLGFSDLSVLDISPAALDLSRRRLGANALVTWLAADLLEWVPTRRYDVWHDRAVLHFLVGSEIERYRRTLRRALAPGGAAIIATFAPDGPERCSGLPVTRYSADELTAMLGAGFSLVEQRREHHITPSGGDQPFTWVAARYEPS